jgi:hypothetical protein
MHVVTAPPDVGVADRLHAPVAPRLTCHGIRRRLGDELALVDPRLGDVVELDDLRRTFFELGGEAAVEHVTRFDEVIIDRDDRVTHLSRLGVREQPGVLDRGGHDGAPPSAAWGPRRVVRRLFRRTGHDPVYAGVARALVRALERTQYAQPGD